MFRSISGMIKGKLWRNRGKMIEPYYQRAFYRQVLSHAPWNSPPAEQTENEIPEAVAPPRCNNPKDQRGNRSMIHPMAADADPELESAS
jgi:hypothetical protein